MRDKFDPIIFECFTQEQVKEINKNIKKNIITKEDSLKASDHATKKGDFFLIPCSPLIELLHPWLYQCQQINRNLFGYDIYWDFHLESFNYNVYGTKGDKYDWHIDARGFGVSDIKLTCLLNLSEESYEGGQFSDIASKKEFPNFVSGNGLVVVSMIAHKVTPIIKGKRITLTYWAYGSSWK